MSKMSKVDENWKRVERWVDDFFRMHPSLDMTAFQCLQTSTIISTIKMYEGTDFPHDMFLSAYHAVLGIPNPLLGNDDYIRAWGTTIYKAAFEMDLSSIINFELVGISSHERYESVLHITKEFARRVTSKIMENLLIYTSLEPAMNSCRISERQ